MKMFRSAIAVLMIVFIAGLPGMVSAQESKVELSPFAGYMLGGSVKFYEGKFKVRDDLSYGGMLAFRIRPSQLVEISYIRMDTKGDWKPYSGWVVDFPPKTVDVAMNYLQIGTVNELVLDNDAVRPYGTLSIGAAWLHG